MNKLFTFLFLFLTLSLQGQVPADTLRLNDPKYLVGYWPLSKDAKDYSGNGNHGTWSGTEAYTQGPFGKDVGSFNGLSYLIIPNLNPTTNVTISCWVKTTRAGTQQILVSLYGSEVSKILGISVTGNIMTESIGMASTELLSIGQWYHVCRTANKTYINGKEVVYSSGSFAQAGTTSYIAARNTIFPHYGNITGMRVYNVSLTSSEASALYQLEQRAILPPVRQMIPDNSLILHLNNGKDISRFNRPITNYKVGVGNGPMKFNGVDSYLSTPDFIGTNNFTCMVWFRANSLGEGGSGIFFSNGSTQFGMQSTTKVYLSNNGGATAASTDNLGFVYPQWNCITVTRSNDIATFYKNGVLLGLGQSAGTLTPASTLFYVGNVSTFIRTFDGLMSDMMIFDRVLTEHEIKYLYLNMQPAY